MKKYSMQKPEKIPVKQLEIAQNSGGKFMKIMQSTLQRIHDQGIFQWEVLMKNPATVVLPITTNKELILIDQFRYPIMDWELECPAETLDTIGDTPERAAIRALQEEVGFRANRLIQMPTYASSGGTMNEIVYSYIALDCVPMHEGFCRSDDEVIRMNYVPLGDVRMFLDSRISQGQIINPKMDALIGRYMSGV